MDWGWWWARAISYLKETNQRDRLFWRRWREDWLSFRWQFSTLVTVDLELAWSGWIAPRSNHHHGPLIKAIQRVMIHVAPMKINGIKSIHDSLLGSPNCNPTKSTKITTRRRFVWIVYIFKFIGSIQFDRDRIAFTKLLVKLYCMQE